MTYSLSTIDNAHDARQDTVTVAERDSFSRLATIAELEASLGYAAKWDRDYDITVNRGVGSIRGTVIA